MATNCKFCSTFLEDGELCSCKEAVEARSAAAAQNPFPKAAQPEAAAQPELIVVPGAQSAPTPPPQAAQGAPKGEQAQQVLQSVKDKVQSVDYKGIGMELRDVALAALKDPQGSGATSERITAGGAGALLGIQAVAFMLMMWVTLSKIGSAMSPMYFDGVPFRTVVYCLVVALLEMVWLYGALFVFGMVFGGKMKPRELLSTVAVASPVWTGAFLLSMLFTLIFGFDGLGFYLGVGLFLFVLVYSVYMLAASVRSQVPEKVNVFLLVSLAYAVQAIITVRLVAGILSSAAGNAFGSYYW